MTFPRKVEYIALPLNIRILGGTAAVDTYISISQVSKPHDCLQFVSSSRPNVNSLVRR